MNMFFGSSVVLFTLAACGGSATHTQQPTETAPADQAEHVEPQTGSIEAAVASPHRLAKNASRDGFRHPNETLKFFGLEPNMTVIELAPGRGWYSEILAAVLHPDGQLVAAVPPKYQDAFDEFVARQPLYQGVQAVTFEPGEALKLGEPQSADMVLTFRNTHNWIQAGSEQSVYAAAFEVLRPGGVLGVVQHRAKEDANPAQSAQSGYVPQAHVTALAKKAGFVLEEASEINANPADTTNHPEGVWTLPPVLRLGDQDREKYEAIGESDRMTLRFRKP